MKKLLLVFVCMTVFAACKNNDAELVTIINAISPTSGGANTLVTIVGSNFKTTPADNKVTFNGIPATVQSATANSLIVTTPENSGTGMVLVNGTTTGPVFTYTYNEEDPYPGFLKASGFDQKIYPFESIAAGNNSNVTAQTGLQFKALVNGKINAFVLSIPVQQSNVKVTLWEKGNAVPIRAEVFNDIPGKIESVQIISPITLLKDHEYIIQMNVKSLYHRERTNGSVLVYPIKSGNIEIYATPTVISDDPYYNEGSNASYCRGDLSFKFLQTE